MRDSKDDESRVKKKLIEFKIDEETAEKMIRDYGNNVLKLIEDKPYVLCHYITEFELIKEIIKKNKGCKGKEESSRKIVAAAIIHILETMTALEGHTFIYRDELVYKAMEYVEEFNQELMHSVLEHLELREEIVIDEDAEKRECVYPANFYKAEVHVANIVRYLMRKHKADNKALEKVKEFLVNYKCVDITLKEGQQEAVKVALLSPISIISGGAGSGKTTVIKAIFDGFRYLGQTNIKLVSFTGKAAERASAITGMEATTIHRLLGLSEEGRKKVDSIKSDVIIVDEVGMLGLELFNMLLQSVNENKNLKIVLVGDENQLPSIAPGNVLKDLIKSGVIPVVHLTEIVRQDKDSLIISNANKVLRGIRLDGSKAGLRLKKGEFEFIEVDSERIKDNVINVMDKLLDKEGSIYDIQVMSPIKGRNNGVEELNREIAERFNYFQEREVYKFGVLDPVIVIRNNYKKKVFNGQRGIVIRVERNIIRTEAVTVDFDRREVTFKNNELDDIEIAYATSVHKMQGSEAKTVIIVVDKEQSRILTRELIYVAITRGVQRVIVVGDKATFNEVIKKAGKERYSMLSEKLVKGNKVIRIEPA